MVVFFFEQAQVMYRWKFLIQAFVRNLCPLEILNLSFYQKSLSLGMLANRGTVSSFDKE